jgi:ATP-dependent helicase HepA
MIRSLPQAAWRVFLTGATFHPGQRWVSNTESELGLGIVTSVAHRRVEMNYPAAGERRVYAIDNAPLSRVQYQPGEEVKTQAGELVKIDSVIEANHCLIYSAHSESGGALVLPEQELDSAVQFSKPQDRLFSGQIDRNRAFQLRCETLRHSRNHQQSSVLGLHGARVQLLPHQLFIASEVASRYAPRVLLADEVGLGKTIEAGLILHQQWISGRARRALIVVPDSLLHQWLVEMLRRFNLMFSIIDGSSFSPAKVPDDSLEMDMPDEAGGDTEAPAPGDNPFEGTQLALCTLSCLSDHPDRQAMALAAEWDLLIVDEAHHLRWSEHEVSPQYACIEALAKQASGLLLLTATPEQLGIESHFARLRLLDPDRYHDLKIFIQEERQHQPVNQLVQALLSEDALEHLRTADFRQQLQTFLGKATVTPLFELADPDSGPETKVEFSAAVNAIIRDLLDRHGTGRVLFRNTRATISGFPQRQLLQHPLVAPERLSGIECEAGPEQLLTPETLLGETWLTEDTRVPWLADFLVEHRQEKVLVICAFAATAIALEEYLRVKAGVLAAVFHEGLTLVARDRAAARFATEEQGAQVLVCSEIGSEGRNFQFAHHLVLFDLPLVPDLLEQRIGRLDRIGQRETVKIHLPCFTGSAQEVLLRWYHEGLDAIERTCPAGQTLFDRFERELKNCMVTPHDQPALTRLLQDSQKAMAETRLALQQGRDRLLELNSFNKERADEIVGQMIEQERRQDLSSHMEKIFDHFGVEQEHHSTNSLVLKPGDHMLVHGFPGLPEEGVTATFQRDLALAREDFQFLTWEHPMVSGAMDLVINGEFGNTAFVTFQLPPLKPGTILLEAIFTVSAIAPAGLQLHRYLPLTSVRLLVDHRLTDLSGILSGVQLDRLAKEAPLHSARELVRHTRPQLTRMIGQLEKLADDEMVKIRDASIAAMQSEQKIELERLQALARVNPNIRAEEIQRLEALPGQLETCLRQAQMRLDALRVAMVSE